jgi:hypothetical protein
MTTVTLDQAVDYVMQLTPEQREMLVEILYRRQVEARRREIAEDAGATLAAFRAGEYQPQTAGEIIRELWSSLEDQE